MNLKFIALSFTALLLTLKINSVNASSPYSLDPSAATHSDTKFQPYSNLGKKYNFNRLDLKLLLASSDDNILLDVLPSILATQNNNNNNNDNETEPEELAPEWAVANSVCCPMSPSTFSVALDDQISSTTLDSCDEIESRSDEFIIATTGMKLITGTLSADTCGEPLIFTLEQNFEQSTRYLISLEFIDGNPVMTIASEEIETANDLENDSES